MPPWTVLQAQVLPLGHGSDPPRRTGLPTYSRLVLFARSRTILLREPLRKLLDDLLDPPPLLVSRPPTDRPAHRRISASPRIPARKRHRVGVETSNAPRTQCHSHERANGPIGRDEHTRAEPADDADARAARDPAQQTTPCARYLADLLKVVEDGDPLSLPAAKLASARCAPVGAHLDGLFDVGPVVPR